MFERYSEGARRAVFFARFEATQRGGSEIEPRDLFLGGMHINHRPGCPFGRLHADRNELRALLVTDAKPAIPSTTELPLSVTGKKCLAYAAEEADQDGNRVIGTEHLLRGAFRTDDEALARLANAGYTLTLLRSASKEAQSFEAEKKAPWGTCGCGRKEPPVPPDMSQVRILKIIPKRD